MKFVKRDRCFFQPKFYTQKEKIIDSVHTHVHGFYFHSPLHFITLHFWPTFQSNSKLRSVWVETRSVSWLENQYRMEINIHLNSNISHEPNPEQPEAESVCHE